MTGEVSSAKVMIACKAKSQKERAKALPEVTLGANGMLELLSLFFMPNHGIFGDLTT
jgi:hypothetical protein